MKEFCNRILSLGIQNFTFSVYNFFRQSDLPPLVEMTASLNLPGPSPSPSMRAASEPQELLGSACTGSQVYHPGSLVWQTDPDAVMGVSQGASWQCPAGQLLLMRTYSFAHQDSSGPSLSVLPHSAPCALPFHACLQVISASFHEAQMIGQRR